MLAAPNAEGGGGQVEIVGALSPTRTAAFWKTSSPIRPGEIGERTLVLIKPDNFKFSTGRPGNVIDFFSRTGLYIVGVKVLHMSMAQAMEFYGPVREVLRTKLKDGVARTRQGRCWKRNSASKFRRTEQKALGEILGPLHGDNQFDNIVRFMSGHTPSECKTGSGTPAARHAKVHRAGL